MHVSSWRVDDPTTHIARVLMEVRAHLPKMNGYGFRMIRVSHGVPITRDEAKWYHTIFCRAPQVWEVPGTIDAESLCQMVRLNSPLSALALLPKFLKMYLTDTLIKAFPGLPVCIPTFTPPEDTSAGTSAPRCQSMNVLVMPHTLSTPMSTDR